MALIDPAYEESVAQQVTEKYLKSFPELTGKYDVFMCESANGMVL